ncbi:hypothetical protein SLA_7540 [Streptomyces laurentii]|uniref:Uncharacterized protein n=1 Tax=Streptomyces laurentii TaxID=39478 RepID=A0A169PTX0_STRLU|nr:hypothetical protein SLA_7540 [Streptomyces laurentii]
MLEAPGAGGFGSCCGTGGGGRAVIVRSLERGRRSREVAAEGSDPRGVSKTGRSRPPAGSGCGSPVGTADTELAADDDLEITQIGLLAQPADQTAAVERTVSVDTGDDHHVGR